MMGLSMMGFSNCDCARTAPGCSATDSEIGVEYSSFRFILETAVGIITQIYYFCETELQIIIQNE